MVRIDDYDPSWRGLGVEARDEIRSACEGLTEHVEHVGSTSVPNLAAKPVLDIAVGTTRDDSFEPIKEAIGAVGYNYRGFQPNGVGHLLVRETEPNVRTVHVHVVAFGSADWNEYICFRDLLTSDGDIRRAYEDLKRTNAERYPDDRAAYTQAKHAFVQRALRENTNCYASS